MQKLQLTSKEIFSALSIISEDFISKGNEKENLSFCSLRKIQNNGIYYLEDNNLDYSEIGNSLILCKSFITLNESNSFLIVDEPQLVFYKLMNYFYEKKHISKIDSTAIIHPNAIIEEGVSIGAYSLIGECLIKKGSAIKSHVVLEDGVQIGEKCIIDSHSSIGANGVAWIWDKKFKKRVIQPQIGGCIIGNDCFIGSNVTIVRGSVNESTIIGNGTLIAHGTKIGHGCYIGEGNHFANSVSLAGNVETGDRCFFGSGSVVRPMVKIVRDTTIGAGAVVVNNIEIPHGLAVGVPAKIKHSDKQKLSGVPLPL